MSAAQGMAGKEFGNGPQCDRWPSQTVSLTNQDGPSGGLVPSCVKPLPEEDAGRAMVLHFLRGVPHSVFLSNLLGPLAGMTMAAPGLAQRRKGKGTVANGGATHSLAL